MKLSTYLSSNGIQPSAFAERIGKARNSVYRYINGTRIPAEDVMLDIVRETKGNVTPNDFYASSEAAHD